MNIDFYWRLTEKEWDDYRNNYDNDYYSSMDSIGQCRVGDLCYDLINRDYCENGFYLDYDLYVGGVDFGYGYTSNGYPYDYADGGGWSMKEIKGLSFEEFKKKAEKDLLEYIIKTDYLDKATQPLHIW